MDAVPSDARPLPWAPAYLITRDGQVYSTKYGGARLLKPGYHPQGYVKYAIMVEGKARTTKAHRLVAAVWLPPCPSPLHCIRHLDGNPRNNSADNLAWGTQQENIDDKRRHGTLACGDRSGSRLHPERRPRGSRAASAKLTESDVASVLRRLTSGESGASIARDFGVAKTTISAIRRGRNWAWLTTPPDIEGCLRKQGWNLEGR